ncbi:MAG: hypothetical protein HZA12_07525, partial [Nitrospirae bacterium]|nr:hypothetical protein [Nitrospirota bacterium]
MTIQPPPRNTHSDLYPDCNQGRHRNWHSNIEPCAGIDCGTDCTEAYNSGTVVTLTATADTGSTFSGWSGGGCTGTSACTITMTADTSITATFDPVSTSGSTFPIAATAGEELGFSAAFDGTNYLVGIEGDASNPNNITAQLVSQSGTKVGSPISVGKTGNFPLVAFDGTNYLMVWEDDIFVYGQFIDKQGSLLNTPFQIAPLGQSTEMSGLGFGGGNYLAEYDIGSPGSRKRMGRIVSPSGIVGSEIIISTGFACCGFGGAFDGTNFLTTWTDDVNGSEVKGRFISPQGTLGTEFTINASPAESNNGGSSAFDGTNHLVIWIDNAGANGTEGDIFGQLVDTQGNPVGGVITISNKPRTQSPASIAFDGTNYLVTWIDMANDANNNNACDAGEGTCWDVFGQFISKSGTLVGSEFPINTDAGNQMGFAIFGGGKYLVVIATGFTPNTFIEDDILGGDVYGTFITPIDTSNTGTVTGTVTYAGSLGPVSASRPIIIILNPFPNEFDNLAINGTFAQQMTLTTSPSNFTFTNVPAGQYHLVVILDIDNNGPSDPNPAITGDGDPVEIYTPGNEAGSNFHADPATA